MRLWRTSLLGVLLVFATVSAQSVDEEERVHVGGNVEGSGDHLDSDDEDLSDGSGLPPEQNYATSMSPKFSTKPDSDQPVPQLSATTVRATTTIIRSEKVSSTTTQRVATAGSVKITTRAPESGTDRASNSATFSMIVILVLIFALIVVLLITIVIIVICRRRSNSKQGYSPGVPR